MIHPSQIYNGFGFMPKVVVKKDVKSSPANRGPKLGKRFFRGISAGLFAGLLILNSTAAVALDEELDQGKVYAIQYRDYRMNHEFSLTLGFLPLDAFYKFFAISGHYVLHFDDLWAWEAIHFAFSKYLYIDTGLQGELGEKWDVQATDTPKVDYFLDTNLMLKPLYGKIAVLDSSLIYGETYILFGVGTFKSEATVTFPISLNLGVGLRIFLSDTISLRLESREYGIIDMQSGGFESVLYFGFGFSYNAFADEKIIEANKRKEAGQ